MVESQVRPSDVTDRRVLRAMAQVPRERFVTSGLRSIAYSDGPVKVSDQPVRYLLAPRTLGKLVQLLEIGDRDVVLVLGCSTGYSTAIIARVAQSVVAVEEEAALADKAQTLLADLGINNTAVVAGSLTSGKASEGPFDAIFINGSVEEVPAAILDQLKDGGRLVTVEPHDGVGRAVQWRRSGKTYGRRVAFDAAAPRLSEFDKKREFVF
ncbi:MAG TPA: protein-L-isoaspartate O-methyltransferase [Hyphomicrobiaceae bacterium]|nr:protein-L-isoaspartate O-methyltransferase [Hyphomicrobiaceae bacterium]